MKKLLCCLLCFALVIPMFIGLGTVGAAAEGKTDLRIAVHMDAPGFNPYTAGYNCSSSLIIRNIYETLINMDDAGNLYPGLATEWEWGENNMSIILTLREGVKFSNGEDFNADSVIYSLRDYRGQTAVGGEGESLYDFDNMKSVIPDARNSAPFFPPWAFCDAAARYQFGRLQAITVPQANKKLPFRFKAFAQFVYNARRIVWFDFAVFFLLRVRACDNTNFFHGFSLQSQIKTARIFPGGFGFAIDY